MRQKLPFVALLSLNLTFLTKPDDLQFYSFFCNQCNFILLYGWIILYYVHRSHFLYPLFWFSSTVTFFVVLEFEIRDSWLLGRCLIAWAMPPVLFALTTFEIRFHFLSRQAWIMIILFEASYCS
jgi:hypothetical protein